MATRTSAALTAAQATEVAEQPINVFGTVKGFETAQRMAQCFATSPMVPDTYKNNIGSCVIALDIANRIGASPLLVMQNLYMVHGNPSWSSKFLVACFNTCGRFEPITYETNVATEQDKEKWYCVARSVIRSTGEVVEGDRITWQMVKAEGWASKNGSKWMTMPGQMFRYRAAAFLIRTVAPEISFGFYTQEEAIDGAARVIETAEATEIETETAATAPASQPQQPAQDLFSGVNI